jgi:hypothetical protein
VNDVNCEPIELRGAGLVDDFCMHFLNMHAELDGLPDKIDIELTPSGCIW